MKNIIIKGAREHNLKNIDLELPRDRFIVITGLSGSGKSTLAFDTLYAEGQRRYVESLSAYARQFLGVMNKPDLDSIEGISPAIAIEQRRTSKNPRSTVGTVTEIYDYLRLLFARIGIPHCPIHGIEIVSQSPEKISERIVEETRGSIIVLSPIIRQKKGTYEKLISELYKEGYTRVRVNKEIHRTDEKIELERYKKHDIEIVIDRLHVGDRSRLSEAVENALERSDGLVVVLDEEGVEHVYSSSMACPICGISFEELQPRMFSFNSPFGACQVCHGLGIRMEFDPDLVIPDKNKCIADDAIAIYRSAIDGWRGQYVAAVAKHFGFDIFTPIKDLTEEQHNALMYGSDEQIRFSMTMKNGDAKWSHTREWEGLLPQSERLYRETKSEYRRHELERFMRRSSGTLSGGEAQRIRLATQIGSNLMGVLYILDEPSIGLHQRDNQKLIDTLHRLRDIGNTLVVVEHDEETIRRADYVVDMGPGAGLDGGQVIAEGTPREIEENPESLTGRYLSRELKIPVPAKRRKSKSFIQLRGCRENNLKNIDVSIPSGVLTLVTGVSGSGKSTLVYEILYRGMMQKLYGSRERAGLHEEIVSGGEVDRVIVINQRPIGKTPSVYRMRGVQRETLQPRDTGDQV